MGNRQCYVTLPARIRKVSMSQVSHSHVMEREKESSKKSEHLASVGGFS